MTAAPTGGVVDAVLADAFRRHRRELHVHCYRLTGSFTDAEDLTQDTYLRAWQARERFEARASIRTWLYCIATRACLDHLKRRDVLVTMPPEPPCRGWAAATELFRSLLGPQAPGDWALVPTRANGMPATANYLRRDGEQRHRALSIDVLDIRDGRIAMVNCFLGDQMFAAFGLPPELAASATERRPARSVVLR